jgi:hypothetical protein
MVNRDNVIAGAEQQGDDDKDYELATHEEAKAFAKKRNYHISNTDNPIDFPDEDSSNSR